MIIALCGRFTSDLKLSPVVVVVVAVVVVVVVAEEVRQPVQDVPMYLQFAEKQEYICGHKCFFL